MVIISWKWIFESKWRWLPLVLTLLFLIAFIGWVFRPVKNFDAESRARMWRRGVMAWQAKPITGWGWSGFAQAIETYDWPYPVRFDVYVDKAHSSMVETGVTTGLVGLGLYCLLWLNGLRRLARNQPVWFIIGLTYLIACQLNVVSIATDMVGWLALGLSMQERA